MTSTELFIRSLHDVEKNHTPDPLLGLFTEHSTLSRLTSNEVYKGLEGARAFWKEYLSFFKQIESRFINVIHAGDTAVLEWEAEGRFETGEPIHYRGVSVVEFENGKVKGFRTYYDSAKFNQAAHR